MTSFLPYSSTLLDLLSSPGIACPCQWMENVVHCHIVLQIRTIYSSRPTSTTVTQGRSPACGLWTYRKCLDLQPPLTDAESEASSSAVGSPTSVSTVQKLSAKHPGRVTQSLAWAVTDCEGGMMCRWISRPAYGGGSRSLHGHIVSYINAMERRIPPTRECRQVVGRRVSALHEPDV